MPTLHDTITRASQRMQDAGLAFGHGTTCAWDEAAWLVLWRLGLPLDDLDGHAQDPIGPEQAAAIDELITQRIDTRKPAAYLTRQAWLQGVPFYVDERAIVPRSYIAEVIADGSIDVWLGAHTRRVLDLCTGNGSLAVLAALAWPEVEVQAVDISTQALEVARINVRQHELDTRIRLSISDGLNQTDGPYDLIVCNPPYVNARAMRELPQEYRHEPELALASGSDGMDFIRQLIAALRAEPARHLSEEGVLVLEIGNERVHFEAAFPDLPVHWLPTSAGEDALLLVTRLALEPSRWLAPT